MTTLKFDVKGMTCGGCSSGVQKAIGNIDGVTHVDVTLHPGLATVTVDPLRVTAAQIVATVAKAGYAATVQL